MVLLVYFAIPFTIRLNKKCLLKPGKHLATSYLITMLIYLMIFIGMVFLFWIFMRNYFLGLVAGYAIVGVTIASKIKAHGASFKNFKNYFEKNRDCFWEELSKIYDEDQEKLYKYILQVMGTEKSINQK